MRYDRTVAAKRRQQSVAADSTVRKQSHPSAPCIRYVADRQFLPIEKIRNTGRHKRSNERGSNDQHRFSGESVGKMIACVKDTITCD